MSAINVAVLMPTGSPWTAEAMEHLRVALGLETLAFGAYPEPCLIVRGTHVAVVNLLDYMRPVVSPTYLYTVHVVYDSGAVNGLVGSPRQRELEQRHGFLMHRPAGLEGGVTLLATIIAAVGFLKDVPPVPTQDRRGQGATRLRLSDVARR